MTLTRDEFLVILAEEAAEVIQAATKCLRFGFYTIGPGDYGRNDFALARECGQFLRIANALKLDPAAWNQGYEEKLEKVEAYKAEVRIMRTLYNEIDPPSSRKSRPK
jgi:hypothetical protein